MSLFRPYLCKGGWVGDYACVGRDAACVNGAGRDVLVLLSSRTLLPSQSRPACRSLIKQVHTLQNQFPLY